MKKTLLLLASAALLLVGCAKEQMSGQLDGGMTTASFTASVDGGVVTKAVADNNGAGAYVNRCIMEIYFQDELYTRLVQPVTPAAGEAKAYATFANVPVVAGKEYQILFWADCGGAEKADLYYTTTSLKAVTVAKTAFIGALEASENDKLDAFCSADNYTVPQSGKSYTATLKRPFAQLNVITTDLGANKTVTSENLLPEKVSVSYKAADVFNVATGAISNSGEEEYTYTYEAGVYGTWSDTKSELTLSMDYILASTEQAAVDVTFITKNGGQAVMTHSLANLPYKRNYRTNVKGDLLTAGGTWTATIAPAWGNGTDNGEINHFIASSYTDVVNALQSGNDSKNLKVTVTPAAVNNLSDVEKAQVIVDETIDGESVKALKFILYEEKKSGEQVTQQASPKHVEFELPARPSGVAAWKIEYEPAYPTETVVVSTKEENNANVIIEAPKSTVTLDATKINSVVSTTSENTLIIPQGLELKNLTVKKGAVEYHGAGLTKVTVATAGEDKAYFKTSEGLANTPDVYGVVKDHVAPGFAITKESETTWKIVPAVCKIGTKSYATLIDAVAAVQIGETIELLKDYEGDGVVVPEGKNFTLDFGGHTYKVIGNMAGSAGTKNQCFQLLKGSTLVFQNGTITTSCAKLGINSYSDLVVKDLTIDMSETSATDEQLVCIQTCNGNTSLQGNTNLIAKEGRFAILALYWPNSYGDINVELNTAGEVKGCMAYGSYNADVSTVAQHSHVAIKNGKYDCTFDMDGLESYDYKIFGGVFTNKPDESLVADKYEVTENTDAATRDQYPWTVKISPEFVFVAKIGTTEYHTLSDALSAAKDGEAVYIIPDQLEETVNALNDSNIQLILDGKDIIGDITFGGKGTLIVRAEELNTDYYHASKAYEVDAPTIPAQGVGGIMGKISATDDATVMLRENLYSGPFEGNVELRGGFYYSGLGLDNIKAQTPNGIGLVVEQAEEVQGYSMYYVPEVPESYLVHIQNVLELMAAYAEGKVSDEQLNQITLGYGLGERILQPWWVSVDGGDASLSPSGGNYFPNDVYAFFTNLKDGEYDNPKYAYQDWYCDYVISYSEPIKKDYQSGIWGYYSNMSIGCWLPASVTQTPFAMLSAVNMKRTYSQMLSDVGMFLCGPVNLNPDDKGTVITVNLNIYPDSETDKCITTNKVVYTIPAISNN